jgi:hypothetical protein
MKLWKTNYIGDDQINWVGTTHGNYEVPSRYTLAEAKGMLGCSSPAEKLGAINPLTFRIHPSR